jgi:hypothetical protein
VVRERGGAVAGACHLVPGGDLETHLGRPPVLVGQPVHDRVGRAVVPDVEQPAGAPGAHPVVLPGLAVEDTVARVPVVPGQAAELLDVLLAVRAGHQVGADRDEARYAEPNRQTGDQLCHGRSVRHDTRVPT